MRIRNKHITVNGNSTLLLTLQCWSFFNRERKPQNKKNKRQDTHVIEKQQRLSASPSPTRPGPSFHRIHSSQGPLGSKRTRKSEKKKQTDTQDWRSDTNFLGSRAARESSSPAETQPPRKGISSLAHTKTRTGTPTASGDSGSSPMCSTIVLVSRTCPSMRVHCPSPCR